MTGRIGWDLALAALLLAFALSMVIAWIYVLTYQGVGYLRTFVQTIAMSGVVAALVMLAIGDDVARGLGMVGALTLVRFRTTLKDTRDLIFVFSSLAVGVACGVQAFGVAMAGTAVFVVTILFLTWSEFGSRREFDAVLRFRAPSRAEYEERLNWVLGRHCRKLSLINLRAAGDASQEFAYHVKLARPDAGGALMRELEGIPGVQDAIMLKQDATLEL
jgi:uncharacterized membrane protein YhiD involved in acid resistance